MMSPRCQTFCSNCSNVLIGDEHNGHTYNCSNSPITNIVHEYKCQDKKTIIINTPTGYRYACQDGCVISNKPLTQTIKTCPNCFRTGGTSGNINHDYDCTFNHPDDIKHGFSCSNQETVIEKQNNGSYRYRCSHGCSIRYQP